MNTSVILELGELRRAFTIEIFDITGKLLRSEQKSSIKEQLMYQRGQLEAGQYLLRLSGDESSYELPFVEE